MVNLIADILKYKDEEIIEYLSKTMGGILRNYETAVKSNSPEVLYANLGDITLVAQALKAIDKRNKDKLAMAQERE